MKIKFQILTVAGLILGVTPIAKADIIWPADNDWTALMIGANKYYDAEGDQSPSPIDLIGTTDTYSAGYWARVANGYINGPTTDDAFMIRMRVGGNGGNFVWQAHLNTDGDASNVEWILQLVQSGGSDRVSLIKTAVGGPTLGAIDIGNNTPAWSGDVTLFSRWTAVPDSTHFYVDFAVPWTEFSTITGVSSFDEISVILSTSTTHSGINKDAPLGSTLNEQISNVLSNNVPEPTVATLLICAGGGMIAFRRAFKREQDEEESDS